MALNLELQRLQGDDCFQYLITICWDANRQRLQQCLSSDLMILANIQCPQGLLQVYAYI